MIKEAEFFIPTTETHHKNGVAQTTFYKCRSKYSGMEALFCATKSEHSFYCPFFKQLLLKSQPPQTLEQKIFELF
ncbi:hypothetical protein HG263_17200 [Pseudoalteromonas sp. JBTF-M23]|uniref:Uncharacterized protein n=1 Tax=Pseudoalteromonas caenipelagi TaxID=2726988 RepID=A0A849VEW7_9GAMM|nr:hypothetical protein [Pseudoalteromonas caenipelagi]NOU52269.1 hypothetical protein [Pseudoalteromonas caenipelagi]